MTAGVARAPVRAAGSLIAARDPDSSPRRGRAEESPVSARVVPLAVAGAAVACVLAALSLRERGRCELAWMRLQAHAEHDALAWPARIVEREPLLAPAAHGRDERDERDGRAGVAPDDEAFAHYRAAGELALAARADLGLHDEERAAAALAVGAFRAPVAELVLGARCARVAIAALGGDPADAASMWLQNAIRLAQRAALAAKDADACVEITAAALTRAIDQCSQTDPAGEWSATGWLGLSILEWTDEGLAAMPRAALRCLALALARTDAAVSCVPLRPDRLVAGVLRGERADGDPRFAAGPALLAIVDAAGRLRDTRDATWTGRSRALAAFDREWSDTVKLLPRRWGGAADAERWRRDAVARLRLLRLAVAFWLGDPLPALADPLGDGDLAVVVHGDWIRIVSAGGLVRTAGPR